MRVLIVDDEQLNKDGLRMQLQQSCHGISQIDDAGSARAALVRRQNKEHYLAKNARCYFDLIK